MAHVGLDSQHPDFEATTKALNQLYVQMKALREALPSLRQQFQALESVYEDLTHLRNLGMTNAGEA